jgi:tricorn protease
MPRTSRRTLALLTAALSCLALAEPAARADRRPNAGMMRYPDVSATQIVFCYRGHLWLVPRAGGLAEPLAAPPSAVSFPRFSPDGRTVAFIGNYDGNRDLYTIPVDGGVPFRLTYHPGGKTLCDWTPDGNGLVFFASGYAGLGRQDQLLVAPVRGGLAEKLPVPYGEMGAISPDGAWLAYTPYTRDFATWKRYCGGMAPDIWLFNLRDHSSQRITSWEGTDTQPMWCRDKVYYLSDDGPGHRLNIWEYDTQSGKHEQITRFDEFDVKWPAIGPGPTGDGEIVFQNGAELYLLDLKTHETRVVEITVPGDLPAIRPQRVDVHEQIESGDISPTGKRAVFEARGDIWTVPAQKGSPRNLTRTSGVAERFPAWSPDGKWIVYLSDQSGDYELNLMRSDGWGDTRQLTHDGHTFRYNPNWSPDSKHILFTDKTGALYLYTLGEKATEEGDPAGTSKLVDTDPLAAQPQVAWSHDSNWIAYTRNGDNRQSAIWLYCVGTGERQPVTAGMFNDTWPTFDRKGDYLFFASNRHFADPTYEDVGHTFVYAGTDTLVVVPLREKVGSPWAPKSDEESWKEAETTPPTTAPSSEREAPASASATATASSPTEEQPEGEKKEEKKKDEEKTPVVIELAGFEQRAITLPVKPGAFTNLAVNHDGKLLYVRHGERGSGAPPAIKIFDLTDEKKEEKTVLEGVRGFGISADGKKLLVSKGATFAIVDAAPDQKLDKPLVLDGLATIIQPREEWRQLFLESWRLERDFFYDPHMHGVNWPAMRDHYSQMLDDCVSRADVGYVIRELISELNVGHAYYFGNDSPNEPSVACGVLGCDFELADGAYRIKDIVHGASWDFDARGPLSQPGVNVKEGDYLLAVNGVPLSVASDPWAAFQGLPPGRTVALTVSDQPTLEVPEGPPVGAAKKKAAKGEEKDEKSGDEKTDEEEAPTTGQRDVLVTLISAGDEGALRYRAWVEKNRAYVDAKTDGKVGYIHVPDTGTNGQNELFRQFYGQRTKAALIIDERWNGGGQIPDRFIELLHRPLTNMWAERDGLDTPSPQLAHHGPKCMLINGAAGSGGDAFPYYFRQAKLGKLIGMRTWGGLVGIGGNPNLIDGTTVTVPRFAFYKLNGTWAVEGHGVDPDIEVVDDPALMVDGGDPQLDKAIELMQSEIEHNPFVPPKRPSGPDRSGMGVLEKDR